MSQKHVNLFGPVNSTGYGTHFFHWARALVPQLVQRGVESVVVPRGGSISREEFAQNYQPTGADNLFGQACEAQATMRHDADVSIMLWHPHQLAEFAGKFRIGYTTWEGTELRIEELNQLMQLDAVAVVSMWHKAALERMFDAYEGPFKDLNRPPILLWPEGVDASVYSPIPMESRLDATAFGPLKDSSFDFTWVNVGKYEKRKGTDLLLSAFSELAQKNKDNTNRVRLLLSCYNPFSDRPQGNWQKAISMALQNAGFDTKSATVDKEKGMVRFSHGANDNYVVDLIATWLQSKRDIACVYRAGDAACFPFYAEGWGLPTIEAMASGLPTIATFYSGTTEFLCKRGPNGELPLEEGTSNPIIEPNERGSDCA